MKQQPCPGLARRNSGGFRLLSGAVLLAAILPIALTAQSSNEPSRAYAERLTLSLMALHSQYQSASPAGRTALAPQLRGVAAERQQLLSALIESNPGEVLRVAVPAQVAAHMPASVQAFLEQEFQSQGRLQVTVEDAKDGSKLHHFVTTSSGKLELKFASQTPSNLMTGATVRVHGTRLGNALALSSGNNTSSFQVVTAAALPNTFGVQTALVILVNFQDNSTQPWTVQSAQSMVFTTASNFWMENSFQQTWLTGDVAGWFTLPISSSTCDTASIQTYAQQAAQNAGYVLSNYNHYVYMFPAISTCGWSGYSYIGGIPSSSWVNGLLDQQVVSHELGHALGLYHSHSLSCGSLVYAATGCTQYEYGDYYETMGNSTVNGYSMDYNAFQKERLGWLNTSAQPPITTVTASGTYQLGPYETQDTTAKALKILQSGSAGTYYYVELRQALGDDSALSNSAIPGYSQVLNGVVIHVAAPGNANGSDLLNMNPSSTWGYAMALDLGQSYTDSTAGVTISPTAVSSTGATVQVTLTGSACTPANPMVSVSPSQGQYVPAGTPVTFTATVKDNDSSACSSATFNLNDTISTGWAGVWNTQALSLSPGASGSATVSVTSPTGTADGFYNVSVAATNAAATSATGSASATYVVSTPVPMTASVSTNQSSYSPNQTVTVNVTVLSGTAPEAGVSVTARVTPPSGRGQTMTGTTGSNGVVAFSYKLSKRAAAGTYQVQGSANGSAASASTTFAVQ